MTGCAVLIPDATGGTYCTEPPEWEWAVGDHRMRLCALHVRYYQDAPCWSAERCLLLQRLLPLGV